MKVESTMREMTNTDRIMNRHKARLLQNLEDVGCPQIFRDAVTSELNWLRSDLKKNESDVEEYDSSNTRGNR